MAVHTYLQVHLRSAAIYGNGRSYAQTASDQNVNAPYPGTNGHTYEAKIHKLQKKFSEIQNYLPTEIKDLPHVISRIKNSATCDPANQSQYTNAIFRL